jgi:hypothetical protein
VFPKLIAAFSIGVDAASSFPNFIGKRGMAAERLCGEELQSASDILGKSNKVLRLRECCAFASLRMTDCLEEAYRETDCLEEAYRETNRLEKGSREMAPAIHLARNGISRRSGGVPKCNLGTREKRKLLAIWSPPSNLSP